MSIKNIAKLTSIIVLTAGVGLGLTACSFSVSSPMETASQVAPQIQGLSSLQDNVAVNMTVGEMFVINTGDIDPSIVMIQDTDAVNNPNNDIVQFIAGGVSGTSVNNPAFMSISKGSAHIILVNSDNGVILADFTINVV